MVTLKTGTVARILGCSQQNVIRMVDRGILEGFRLPGSTHRRVQPESVLAVAIEAGMPIVGELAGLKATLESERAETPETALDNAVEHATIE